MDTVSPPAPTSKVRRDKKRMSAPGITTTGHRYRTLVRARACAFPNARVKQSGTHFFDATSAKKAKGNLRRIARARRRLSAIAQKPVVVRTAPAIAMSQRKLSHAPHRSRHLQARWPQLRQTSAFPITSMRRSRYRRFLNTRVPRKSAHHIQSGKSKAARRSIPIPPRRPQVDIRSEKRRRTPPTRHALREMLAAGRARREMGVRRDRSKGQARMESGQSRQSPGR